MNCGVRRGPQFIGFVVTIPRAAKFLTDVVASSNRFAALIVNAVA
jgi:hypothetical protein